LSDRDKILHLSDMKNYRTQRVGVIIHLHTIHTPCVSCATALCRECEVGGLFKRIFEDTTVKLICITAKYYIREIELEKLNSSKQICGR